MRIGRGGIGGDCVNLRFERASITFACLSIGIVTGRGGFYPLSGDSLQMFVRRHWAAYRLHF